MSFYKTTCKLCNTEVTRKNSIAVDANGNDPARGNKLTPANRICKDGFACQLRQKRSKACQNQNGPVATES